MKRIFAAISIIIITLSLAVCEYITINNNQKKFVKSLDKCNNLISNNELKDAEKLVEDIDKNWQKSEKLLNIFINHNEIDNIKENLQSLSFYVKNGDTKSFLQLSEKTKRQLLSIKERQLPYLKNII